MGIIDCNHFTQEHDALFDYLEVIGVTDIEEINEIYLMVINVLLNPYGLVVICDETVGLVKYIYPFDMDGNMTGMYCIDEERIRMGIKQIEIRNMILSEIHEAIEDLFNGGIHIRAKK